LALVGLACALWACDRGAGEGETSTTKGAATAAATSTAHAGHHGAASGGASGESPSEDQSGEASTENGSFYVTMAPEPNPIPFQEIFALDVRIYASKSKKEVPEGVQIDQVRAVMPAHNHGMKVEPKVQKEGEGHFRVEGMRFHMQGEGEHGRWVIEVVVNDGSTVDTAKFPVQCCRE
jgi:hypothetical protein